MSNCTWCGHAHHDRECPEFVTVRVYENKIVREERRRCTCRFRKFVGRVEIYRDTADEWRWRMIAPNGETFQAAHEGFSTRQGAKENLRLGWVIIDDEVVVWPHRVPLIEVD